VELPTPAARYLGPGDRGLLAGLRCSTGAWFETDVETFIQTTMADYHGWRRAHSDHTIVALSSTTSGWSLSGRTKRSSSGMVDRSDLDLPGVRGG
jgi:hypothetical protein